MDQDVGEEEGEVEEVVVRVDGDEIVEIVTPQNTAKAKGGNGVASVDVNDNLHVTAEEERRYSDDEGMGEEEEEENEVGSEVEDEDEMKDMEKEEEEKEVESELEDEEEMEDEVDDMEEEEEAESEDDFDDGPAEIGQAKRCGICGEEFEMDQALTEHIMQKHIV